MNAANALAHGAWVTLAAFAALAGVELARLFVDIMPWQSAAALSAGVFAALVHYIRARSRDEVLRMLADAQARKAAVAAAARAAEAAEMTPDPHVAAALADLDGLTTLDDVTPDEWDAVRRATPA